MYYIIKPGHESIRKNCIEYIQSMTITQPMIVEIKQYKKTRSTAQNRLLWKWYSVIAEDTGTQTEDLHEIFKAKILGVEEKTLQMPGKEEKMTITMPKSTKNLTVGQFADFLLGIQQTASDAGMELPLPQDYDFCLYGDS